MNPDWSAGLRPGAWWAEARRTRRVGDRRSLFVAHLGRALNRREPIYRRILDEVREKVQLRLDADPHE